MQRNGEVQGMARILVCWDKGQLERNGGLQGLDEREHEVS